MFNFQLNNFIGGKPGEILTIGEDPEADLNLLIKECKQHLKSFNEQQIRKAFKMCFEAHKNKLRKSGLPFYTHPLSVARIVISEIPLDDVSVVSSLLHDVIDNGEHFTIKDIRSEFGSEIAEIVEGVQQIEHFENFYIKQNETLENYRKLMLSLFKDIRIILIKLADRLHNMRTLESLPLESRIKLSKETMEVYAPFANRFGLRNMKWELEDLSFKYLNRESYDEIKESLNTTREEREKYIENLINPIEEKLSKDELLKKLKVKFEITGRPKHIYSIYNKMRLRQKSIDELYDLFAVRIILEVNDPNLCFYVYGIIGGIFAPVPETFKDYISAPKKNGYQSIHTAIVGPNKKIAEVQIRTVAMHEIAEKGFAAHFKYKGGKVDASSILEDSNILEWMQSVRELFEHPLLSTNEHLLENIRKNLFFDEIYVFTPSNEFRTLPLDSTPLDFAFDIHSEVGFTYVGAKVNGKIVPIDHKLRNGDQIEILTSQTPKVSKEWLKFVVSTKAKNFINKFLKDQEKEAETKGRAIWEARSKEFGIPHSDSDLDKLIKSMGFNTAQQFYIELSSDTINLSKVFEFLRYKAREAQHAEVNPNIQHNGNGTKAHKRFDPNNIDRNDLLKYYDETKGYIIGIKVRASDKPTILAEINQVLLSVENLRIIGIAYESDGIDFEEHIRLNVKTLDTFERLTERIQKLPGIGSISLD